MMRTGPIEPRYSRVMKKQTHVAWRRAEQTYGRLLEVQEAGLASEQLADHFRLILRQTTRRRLGVRRRRVR